MTWEEFFLEEKKKKYFKDLLNFVINEYNKEICHPDFDDIWTSFKLTKLENVKVVILGQDPYHNFNQAHGLAFSVKTGKLPPSLRNIYKEIESNFNIKLNQDGDLSYLAKQGVLLLNDILTVRHLKPLSHKNMGWEVLTNNIIKLLDTLDKPMVFILWGKNARKKSMLIKNKKHIILESAHPSPLSAYHGFFGSKPFSKTNEYLIYNNLEPIRWDKNAYEKIN